LMKLVPKFSGTACSLILARKSKPFMSYKCAGILNHSD
jgi:hypothetical protein